MSYTGRANYASSEDDDDVNVHNIDLQQFVTTGSVEIRADNAIVWQGEVPPAHTHISVDGRGPGGWGGAGGNGMTMVSTSGAYWGNTTCSSIMTTTSAFANPYSTSPFSYYHERPYSDNRQYSFDDLERIQKQQELARQQIQAFKRAFQLLSDKIGSKQAAALAAGGYYTVKSKLWPDIAYMIPGTDPHAKVKIVDHGHVVSDVCIVSTDPTLPWPDIALQRITAIKLDETIVYAKGNFSNHAPVTRVVRSKWEQIKRSIKNKIFIE